MKAARANASSFLELVWASVQEEEDYTVWEVIDSSLGFLSNLVARVEGAQPKFNAFFRAAYANIAKKLGTKPIQAESLSFLDDARTRT